MPLMEENGEESPPLKIDTEYYRRICEQPYLKLAQRDAL